MFRGVLYPSRMTVDELTQSSGAQKFPEISHFHWTCGDLFCRVKGDVGPSPETYEKEVMGNDSAGDFG